MKVYHVETQEDYNDLMIELENEGYLWCSGKSPTSLPENTWSKYGDGFCLIVGETMSYSSISWCECNYKDTPIKKYKAKGVEQMEKVVVPQFVATWFERNKKGHTIYGLLDLFSDNYYSLDGLQEWVENYNLKEENAQEIIAKMYLFQNYKVEEEKYYWKRKSEHSLKVEEPDAVYLNYYVDRGTVFFGSIINGKMVKTKLTEKEVLSLVGEEDFNKLEKVEIEQVVN